MWTDALIVSNTGVTQASVATPQHARCHAGSVTESCLQPTADLQSAEDQRGGDQLGARGIL